MPKMKEIQKVVQKLSRGQESAAGGGLIYRSGPTIMPKMKEIQKVVQKLSRGQESAAAAAAYEPVQKHKVTPSILGWLNKIWG